MLAKYDQRLASKAEERTLQTLMKDDDGRARNNVLSQIRLARVRFVAGEPEQACDDGERAVALAANTASAMVRIRLRDLLTDSEPHDALPRVAGLRGEIRVVSSRPGGSIP